MKANLGKLKLLCLKYGQMFSEHVTISPREMKIKNGAGK